MSHSCRIVPAPWPGVFATDVDSGCQYERHWHATFGIGVMQRGAHRSMSGRGVVDAYAGDVITNNPGEVHDGRPLGALTRRWRMVYLDPAAVACLWTETNVAAVELTRPVIHDARLAASLRRLMRRLDDWSAAGPEAGDALACEESLVMSCGLALRHHSTARAIVEPRGDVARARECLAGRIRTPPSLAELAASVGLSKYQLLRRFQRAYGMSPHEWLRQVRVERARAAIRRGTSLAEAADACGFADQSHMTRAFVAHFGFTPGAWGDATGRASRP